MPGDKDGTKVHVATSTRMPNPDDPDDVIHGKRFTNPKTGEPASIPDILAALGLLKPESEETSKDYDVTSEGRP